jgi:ribose transport system ATP-binding protein
MDTHSTLRVEGAARPDPVITVRGAGKRFGATQALHDVDLDIRPREVLALLGQNGAGKSTLIKVLAGVYDLDTGSALVGGHPVGTPAADGMIAFVHQDLALVPGLSVAENIALGAGYPRRGRLIAWGAARTRAERALAIIGSDLDPRTRVADLSRTDKSLVAIARALVVDAKVLVLDEPTASLPVDETHRLFTVLRRLRDDGMALVYVSHRLDEVFEIADRVTIMRDGRVVGETAVAATTPQQVVTAIVGRQPVPPAPPSPPADETKVLVLDGVVGERVGPVSLEVRAGEVVGLVGLSGAGQVELGRTVLGASACFEGVLELHGRAYRPTSVAAAVGRGLGFVTSNRAEEGLAVSLTVTENLVPNPSVRGTGRLEFRRHGVERVLAQRLVEEYGVRPADPTLPVAGLSGGNQQKVILARWLSTDASVLILEEPTAGVDVGAKHEIYTLLDRALARGVAALLISTDFEEVAQVCHRALVFKDGRIVREIPRADLSVKSLVAYASGAAA